ncbi:MAG: hypothetical protein U1E26_04350 [Coriobacteriia bacterium]|nr:hypothetical protein [Coriobacteriia bacterium]
MRRGVWAAVLCIGWVLLAAQGALAAAPLATGAMQVQVWPEEVPGGAVVIASLTVPDRTPLPATVRIPVPEGLKVDWAGEISGVNPESDVVRPFVLKMGAKGQYAEFEISTTREAQIDMSTLSLVTEGDTTQVLLPWVQSAPASETLFSVRLPAGTELSESSPEQFGKPSMNDIGESLYALETQTLDEGEALPVTLEYRRKAPATASSEGGDTIIAWLFVLLGLAVVVLVVVIMRQRSRPAHLEE